MRRSVRKREKTSGLDGAAAAMVVCRGYRRRNLVEELLAAHRGVGAAGAASPAGDGTRRMSGGAAGERDRST